MNNTDSRLPERKKLSLPSNVKRRDDRPGTSPNKPAKKKKMFSNESYLSRQIGRDVILELVNGVAARMTVLEVGRHSILTEEGGVEALIFKSSIASITPLEQVEDDG